MTRAADMLRERATQAALDGRTHDAAVIAVVADLKDRVDEHNADCRKMCGEGEREGVRCGYRQYFPRHCPECPAQNWTVAEKESAALERAITGESE